MQKYLAAQGVCFTFHIESSLLLAQEKKYEYSLYEML